MSNKCKAKVLGNWSTGTEMPCEGILDVLYYAKRTVIGSQEHSFPGGFLLLRMFLKNSNPTCSLGFNSPVSRSRHILWP